jgi:predicted RNA-binding protein YlxR (DUF448 family)
MVGHTAVRMCVICRKRRPKDELSRYVRALSQGALAWDEKKILPGRGVYHCLDAVCGEAFALRQTKKKAKGRSL